MKLSRHKLEFNLNSLTFVQLAFICFVVITQTMATPVSATFSKGVSDFSADIYTKCIEENKGNIILSPLSIQTAVSLAYMGATGETAAQMATGLKLGANRVAIAGEFGNFIDSIQNNTMLKLANRVYVMKKYEIKNEFNEIATKQYHSSAVSLDFADNVNSANTINGWVEDNTNHKIKDLIKPDVLDSDTRMVLVNAIYFKGFWEHQFKKELTRKLPFYTSATESQNIDMMYTKNSFKYGYFDDLNAFGIELPYKDSDISMFILLPRERDGLSALEAKLPAIDFIERSQKMWKQEVEVTIPKFKIEFEIELKDVLSKMGMSRMFSDAAEFGDLLKSSEPLKVSQVIHKAFIDVNEEGAEAAAATAIGIVALSAFIGETNQFIADHPFLFILKQNENNLFIGRLNKF